MFEATQDRSTEHIKLLSDLYSEAKLCKTHLKNPRKIQLINTSPKINIRKNKYTKEVHNKLDLSCKSKISQFPNGSLNIKIPQRNNTSIKLNKPKKHPQNETKPDQKSLSKNTSVTMKGSLSSREKYKFISKDLQTQISQLKSSDLKKKFSFNRNLNSILTTLEQQCNISNSLNSSREIENSISTSRKNLRKWTERLNWTASKIQEINSFPNPVMKEIYKNDLQTMRFQKIDAEDLGKDIQNRSSEELRSQAKLMKKVLKRRKFKLL